MSKKIHLPDPISAAFPKGHKLVPFLNEIYELRLAAMEAAILPPDQIIVRGAYFRSVYGQDTNHFKICNGSPIVIQSGSQQRKDFFQNNLFRTGYATHGLFPYRGKFHPQMIKALINIMNIKSGDTVLDPTVGSGTTLVESAMTGVHSIGVDISPFCVLMSKAKAEALRLCLSNIKFSFSELRSMKDINYYLLKEPEEIYWRDFGVASNIVKLALFDALGFSYRKNITPEKALSEVVSRYLSVIEKFHEIYPSLSPISLGESNCLIGDARATTFSDHTFDGIIFSPPYSFAIDYVANDIPHLKIMDVNISQIKNSMIGVRGEDPINKFYNYLNDVKQLMSECFRVLKPDKYCTVIVGSNENQIAQVKRQATVESIPPTLELLFIRVMTK